MKTLIIRSADTMIEIAHRIDSPKIGKLATATESILARFTRGNLQAHMFFVALGAASDVAMPDNVETDLTVQDAEWIARGLKMRAPHTEVERILAQGTGLTITA